MIQILKLIRYKNLLFLALTQYAMHQFVVVPLLQKFGFEYFEAGISLWLLLVASVSIAAAGYAINDYFDVKIDRINRPTKILVGETISKQQAMLLHQVLTGIGVVCGLVLAYLVQSFTVAFLFLVIPGLLWFYSASYKRQFLTGNLVVALNAGLSVLAVAIVAIADLNSEFADLIFRTTIPAEIYTWVGGFAVFAFAFTLIREIVKDLQDVEGDREMECRTMAIVWGAKKTKLFLFALLAIACALMWYVVLKEIPFEGSLTMKYSFFGITLPLFVFSYLLIKAQHPIAYAQLSTLLKYCMLIGLLYSLMFNYLLASKFEFPMFNLFLIK